jgi:non-heme chloroperoxidase
MHLNALAAAGYLALAVDLRGHGDSDWAIDGDYSIDAFAEDLRVVVDRLDRPSPLSEHPSVGS